MVAQALRGLAKRDPNTKLKALQTLEDVIAGQSDEVAELLPAWLFHYKKLCMDNNRNVRSKSNRVFSSIVGRVGRKLAPHWKDISGVWCMAMSDPYREACQVSQASFKVCRGLIEISSTFL